MTNPRLLLLDEASLGLAPVAVEAVYESLRALIAGGATLVLVEQDLGRALSVATRVCCMLEGQIVLTGRAEEMTREQVVQAYFGLGREQRTRGRPRDLGQPGRAGRPSRRLLRGARVRALADVRRDADHQPRPRRPRRARRIRGVGARGAPRRLAVARARRRPPGDGGVRLAPAAGDARAQPALRGAHSAPDDVRPRDRDPESALRAVRGRHALALPYIGTLGYSSWSITSEIIVAKLYVLIFAVALALLGGLHLTLSARIRALAPRDSGGSRHGRARGRELAGGLRARGGHRSRDRGARGHFLGMRSSFDPYAGSEQLIFAFEAVVIGGMGSLWGTLLGGIVLGSPRTSARRSTRSASCSRGTSCSSRSSSLGSSSEASPLAAVSRAIVGRRS